MASSKNPFEVARDTLLQLAQQRIPPTPDNYRRLYLEIAGQAEPDELPPDALRQIARQLPRDTPERMRLGHALERALERHPEAAQEAFKALLESYRNVEPPAWNELIPTLLNEWERHQMEWTTARKRQALEHVLAARDPQTLFERLQGLVRSWHQQESDPDSGDPVPIGLSPDAAVPTLAPVFAQPASAPLPALAGSETGAPEVQFLNAGEGAQMMGQYRELLVLALSELLPACLGEHPGLSQDALSLAREARQARRESDLTKLTKRLHKFTIRLERAAGDVTEIRSGLLSLLRLLLENIDRLVLDDRWLHGQIETIREIVERPANLKMIDDAERRLKDLIVRQGELKLSLIAAQDSIKAMLATFLDQLARLDENTGTYHGRLEACAAHLSSVQDITQLGSVLGEVMHATRDMQLQAVHTREELQAARQRVETAEAQLGQMQKELETASQLMRHDPLTGILNRRGLDEALDKEIGRARRRHAPLCVALIDLDNFKKLNDQHGHQVGDSALQTLAGVMRSSLRPQDTAGRFGGEEFVVVLPETRLDDAVTVLTRLQRELTKVFFLTDNRKLLVTFSAGVTSIPPEEDADTALKRADQAMYAAKQAGKNRVHAVSPPGVGA